MNTPTPGLTQFDGCLPRLAIVNAPGRVGWENKVLPARRLFAPMPAVGLLSLGAVHPGGDNDAFARAEKGPLIADIEFSRFGKERRGSPGLSLVGAAKSGFGIYAEDPSSSRRDKRPLVSKRE